PRFRDFLLSPGMQHLQGLSRRSLFSGWCMLGSDNGVNSSSDVHGTPAPPLVLTFYFLPVCLPPCASSGWCVIYCFCNNYYSCCNWSRTATYQQAAFGDKMMMDQHNERCGRS
ncbi:unnamed protein product, partial [Laminaria digitata]